MCLMGAHLPADIPDAGQGACCPGAAMDGPAGCYCWEAVYDLEQADPQPGMPMPPVPVRPCADCAYNAGSPEKTGDDRYQGDAEGLEHRAATGQPFFCHQGMRRTIRLVHPSGVTYDAAPGDYRPPIAGNVPYRADGRPALICAGWLLRRSVLLRQAGQTEAAAAC